MVFMLVRNGILSACGISPQDGSGVNILFDFFYVFLPMGKGWSPSTGFFPQCLPSLVLHFIELWLQFLLYFASHSVNEQNSV